LPGDKINKIQAVLSGSLNFIFNNFDQNSTFHDVVKAGIQGFTEPDPKIDLSGIDVARKILI
jgi:aspartokinase/homoserine dehydrogenase 1